MSRWACNRAPSSRSKKSFTSASDLFRQVQEREQQRQRQQSSNGNDIHWSQEDWSQQERIAREKLQETKAGGAHMPHKDSVPHGLSQRDALRASLTQAAQAQRHNRASVLSPRPATGNAMGARWGPRQAAAQVRHHGLPPPPPPRFDGVSSTQPVPSIPSQPARSIRVKAVFPLKFLVSLKAHKISCRYR